jgi:hypothetical protein
MANTTNYNWETPDDTDLVKDGAAAIRTLGSSVDTTTKALNPSTTLGDMEYRSATANTNTRLAIGTTGQILSVVGGVPAWVANDVGDITAVSAGTGISGGGTSGDITITNSMATAIDAKGDLIVGTGADTFSKLTVGTNTYVLTADSAEATGLKWAAPSGGAAFVGCQATSTATPQAISNATATKVNLDSEDFDTDGFHSNTTNNTRITIPSGKGGYYFVYGLIHWSNNTSGRRVLYFSKNNSTDVQAEGFSVATNTQYPAIWLGRVFNLTAGDYLELEAFQTSGGSLNLNNDPTTIKFGVYKIG